MGSEMCIRDRKRVRDLIVAAHAVPASLADRAAFARLASGYGVTGLSLALDGAQSRTVFAFSAPPGDDAPPGGLLTTRRPVVLAGGQSASVDIEWVAPPGTLAALPHEEVLFQVVADLLASLPDGPADPAVVGTVA